MPRGGARPGNGLKPRYGTAMKVTMRLTDKEVEFIKYAREMSLDLDMIMDGKATVTLYVLKSIKDGVVFYDKDMNTVIEHAETMDKEHLKLLKIQAPARNFDNKTDLDYSMVGAVVSENKSKEITLT